MNLYVNQHIIRGIYEVEGNKNLVSLIPEEFPFFVCHLYNMWGKHLTVQLVYTLLVLVLFWFCCFLLLADCLLLAADVVAFVVYVTVVHSFKSSSVTSCCCCLWYRTRKMKTFFHFHLKGSKTSSWYAFAYFLFLSCIVDVDDC